MENTNDNEIHNAGAPPPLIVKKDLNKDYNRNSTNATMGMVTLVCGIVTLFLFPTAGSGALIACGILLVTTSFQTPLKFRNDHLEFRAAPLSSIIKLDYSAIHKIAYEKKMIILYPKEGNEIKILKNLFNSDDRDEIIKIFKSIIPG